MSIVKCVFLHIVNKYKINNENKIKLLLNSAYLFGKISVKYDPLALIV